MLLQVKKLNQYYGESHTLWDTALEVRAGSCTVLMGRNGVGKTTLLKTIMGLLSAESGQVLFDGTELLQLAPHQRARMGIGYVPQGREIFSQMTVEENLQLGLAVGNAGDEVPELVYELFPVLRQMLKRRGGDLSGGQQQQLAIGRALTLKPRLLILDEPTEGIQPNIVHHIGEVIQRLTREEHITVLLVEQKLPFARRVGQYFTILDRGRSVAADQMSALDEALVQKYLTV